MMKLSTYHKLLGDQVVFIRGLSSEMRSKKWDRVYISTLFTFHWKKTEETIRYYLSAVEARKNVIVGGVLATLFADELEESFGIRVVRGLLNAKGDLDRNSLIVDEMIPDYSILKEVDYEYANTDSYLCHSTRGCPNSCHFCAVNRIEPCFSHYKCLTRQVRSIEELYGTKRKLLLLDNNILASRSFAKIVGEIVELGFYRNATLNGRLRFVDFNQGVDMRLLDEPKMKLIAKTAIKPLRIAFDHISLKNMYIDKVKLASENGILNLSNYVLYNFKDTPKDFYERLRINVYLNNQVGTKIFSFPMRYIPLDAKERGYISKHWSWQLLRGIQCILLATKGKVGPKTDFFHAAFGNTYDDFIRICMMPENYIIYRRHHENNGAMDWNNTYKKLSQNQKRWLFEATALRKFSKDDLRKTSSIKLQRLLSHYIETDRATTSKSIDV